MTLEERKVGVAAPKMFAFDNVFTDMDSQEEVANSALSDIIASGKNIIHLMSFLLTNKFQLLESFTTSKKDCYLSC